MYSIKFLFLTLLAAISFQLKAQIKNIPVAHAHNDYKHRLPLLDAIANGFCSVEADIFYRSGKFLVAHTTFGIRKKNTLQRLYLEPLSKLIKSNNDKIYSDLNTEFELMIDTKGRWSEEQLRELELVLLKYEKVFTIYKNGVPERKAVKVLLSGGGYVNIIKSDNPRIFSVDAGIGEINSSLDSNIICRNSAPYKSYFKWKGRGMMPVHEKEILDRLCADAQQNGRKIRFWACPQNKNVWTVLLDAGVGWINIDKLKKFRKFYWEEYKKN
jgi:hypothetical protein